MSAPSRPPLAEALDQVGDRWTLLVVDALLGGPLRFAELTERVLGIAPNILSDRLRRLERAGLVVARPYSERPRRYEYEVTRAGRGLEDAIRVLEAWGAVRVDPAAAPHHEPCRSRLETRWWCPTCREVVDDDEDDEACLV